MKNKIVSAIPRDPVIFLGLWTIPLTFFGTMLLKYNWTRVLTLRDILNAVLAAIAGVLTVTAIHIYQYIAWGKRKFTIRSAFHNTDLPSTRKLRATHPPVPEHYLCDAPTGYILGKQGRRYVRINPSKDSFCALVCSSPGSGKSVTMMATLIGNYAAVHPRFITIATDPKGELSASFNDLPYIHVISLSDRSKYGYDPLYWYRPEMSDDEMEPYLKTIAESLVSESGGEKNAYFWANARKIMIGLMAWMIRSDRNFPEIMTAMSTHNVMSLVDQALQEAASSKLVKKNLSPYQGKTGEDMESITTEVTTSIDIFAGSEAMSWALGESPRRASPFDIDQEVSLFLQVDQEAIAQNGPFIRLFYAQMFQHIIKSRNEATVDSQPPIWILLEEAPLYGAIPRLDEFLSTCRSKRASAYIVCQSISQLEGAYGKEKAATILDDCLVKVVLGVANNETAEAFSKMAGQYEEDRDSTHSKGIFSLPDSYNHSTERRRIMDPEEFFRLKDEDAVILFIDGKFMKVKKIKYYEDRMLSSLLDYRKREQERSKQCSSEGVSAGYSSEGVSILHNRKEENT